MTIMNITLINKEDIRGKVEFPHDDVLLLPEEKRNREKRLHDAMTLGNAYKGKIRIVFATTEGDRAVETTVWAATEQNVQLKGDVNIPVRAIREVIL